MILKEEELGGKSVSLNQCRISKVKYMTMSGVSTFSCETCLFRLAVDSGVLVRSAEGGGRRFRLGLSSAPCSSAGAPLLPLNLKLTSDRCLMEWLLGSV